MEKRVLLTALFLFTLAGTFAQQNYRRVHKDAFEEATLFLYEEDYYSAAYIYEELYHLDSNYAEINYTLGLCYMNIRGKEDQAHKYLKKAVNGHVKEAYFWLGRSYHNQSNFNEAIKNYKQYKKFEPKDYANEEVDRYIAMTQKAKALIANPVVVEIANMGSSINTKYSEYVPVVSSDLETMYFTSRRPDGIGGLKDDYGQDFEDIYVSRKVNRKWTKAENAGIPLNTSSHDAVVGLTADGNELIIYRTNENLSGGDLYLSELQNGKWSNPKKLSENINSSYQEASASISPDNEIMYISSNRPGGMGGKDIYRVRRLPDGEWSLPENLGPTVNTPYDEDSPFIQADGRSLYFSSNGHNTMGGFDIFKSKLEDDGTWSIPENMGYPINTVKDDIYFVISPDGKTAYYSSANNDGYGKQDIYQIKILYDNERKAIFKGVAYNGSSQEAIKVKITVLDLYTNKIHGIYNSNQDNGKFLMVLQPGRNYKLLVEGNGFQDQKQIIEVQENNEEKIFEMDILVEMTPLTEQ